MIKTIFSKNKSEDYEYINSKPILKLTIDSIVLFLNIIFVLMLLCNVFSYILPKGSYFNFVVGNSMYPTLESGQIMYTSDDLPLRRGDIIMSYFPESEISQFPEKANRNIIKRIIGMPGDYVDIYENGDIYINGIELRETYLTQDAKQKTFIKDKYTHFELKEDEYCIMGDNRGNSNDSRYFGPIKKSDICYKQSIKPTKVTAKKTILLISLMCLIWLVYNLIEFILTGIVYYVITKFTNNKNKQNHSMLKTMFESPEKQIHRTKEHLRRMNIAQSNSEIQETIKNETQEQKKD